jgi:uncharacterized zinc-type alcohol dehydrogenase-like protein
MIKAYAATERGGELSPFEYEPGELGHDEIEIAVEHCGICHSDLSMINNDWAFSTYPIVPGHEVIGTVVTTGVNVAHLQAGQRVGVGWQSGFCMACHDCMSGDHNLCSSATATIAGHHGGFADRMRAQATSAVVLPENLDPAKAGPLFCGGITVYNPLVQFDIPSTARVGIIGIGGLGHMAIKFCAAWGCEVTAFTTSDDKREQAIAMGAHDTLNSTDQDALAEAAGRFDLVLSTVNVALNWPAYLGTLRKRGRLHFVGATLEPVQLSVMQLMASQLSVSSSPVGSPATIAEMLDFAARHNIEPQTEHFPLAKVNDAIAHLKSGAARYRVVLDMQ